MNEELNEVWRAILLNNIYDSIRKDCAKLFKSKDVINEKREYLLKWKNLLSDLNLKEIDKKTINIV